MEEPVRSLSAWLLAGASLSGGAAGDASGGTGKVVLTVPGRSSTTSVVLVVFMDAAGWVNGAASLLIERSNNHMG
jgi:hypothetical protein